MWGAAQTEVVVELRVDDTEDAREGAERGGHADLVLVEVCAETLHQVRKAPERRRLVAVQHVVDDRAQVVHALRVAQVLVVRDERHQDVAQLVQALLLLKERVVPVRPHDVLVCVYTWEGEEWLSVHECTLMVSADVGRQTNLGDPVGKLGAALQLLREHRLPLHLEHVVVRPASTCVKAFAMVVGNEM